jgi:hypothetical protein
MWDRSNQIIHGLYLNQIPFAGVVRGSRVKLGGRVQHTVDLFDPIIVWGEQRDTILVDEDSDFAVDEELV